MYDPTHGSFKTHSSRDVQEFVAHNRLAVIIGGVLGALVLLALLFMSYILWKRRRERKAKDTESGASLPRNLMVQQQHQRPRRVLPLPLSIAHGNRQSASVPPRGSVQATPLPLHSAFTTTDTAIGPLRSSLTPKSPKLARAPPVPPPRRASIVAGSRAAAGGAEPVEESPAVRPVSPYVPATAHAGNGPTERQVQLKKRVRQLEDVMQEVQSRPGMLRVRDQLRLQAAWLRTQMESPWARGETDVPPQHIDLYMGR